MIGGLKPLKNFVLLYEGIWYLTDIYFSLRALLEFNLFQDQPRSMTPWLLKVLLYIMFMCGSGTSLSATNCNFILIIDLLVPGVP